MEFSVFGGILFTPAVGDSKLLLVVGCYRIFTVILHQNNVENHSTNNWPNHLLECFPIDQCLVHRRGDAQMKDATGNLASSTKMRKSFATFFF